MRYKILICTALSLFGLTAVAQKQQAKPVSIIFDSDIGPDYDDAGAITLLHALADNGEAKILATIASNKYEGIAAVLNVFNTYFNRPEIPIGVPKGDGVDMRDSQHWTDILTSKYPHNITLNAEVPDAIKVYRKVLAAQPDHSVTIVTVGFITNLSNLLVSPKDEFSALNGRDLVQKKVKRLVTMGGAFPSGKEFNLEKDAKASKLALENWPTQVIFSGFEIGAKIKTGLELINNSQLQSPAKDAFRVAMSKAPEDAAGRMSWDEVTTLVAVRGYNKFYKLRTGKIKINADGSNTWDGNVKGQCYLVAKVAPEQVGKVLSKLMMQQPEK
ncbi:MAG TPA: nucleoside hydrolase [Arachidicoccus sp.]|nr:nucleoside hydrolase [Arachidicoccus sp.]